MNNIGKKAGRRLSKEKIKIELFNRYKGRRVLEEPDSPYMRILKDKRTLISLKCFLCTCMLLSLGSSSRIENRNPVFIGSPALQGIYNNHKLINRDIKPEFLKSVLSEEVNEYSEVSKAEILPTENLFIGDSRMQGMILSGAVSEEEAIYGVGYGYNWLVGNGTFRSSKTNAIHGAISKLMTKMEEDKTYNIIVWLGVNDLKYRPASLYYNEYLNLASSELSNHNLYIVSVGPVSDFCETSVSNEQINKFNQELKELVMNSGLDNLKYIDLSESDLKILGYDVSGIHYVYRDYRNIYDIIISSINEAPTLKKEINN